MERPEQLMSAKRAIPPTAEYNGGLPAAEVSPASALTCRPDLERLAMVGESSDGLVRMEKKTRSCVSVDGDVESACPPKSVSITADGMHLAC
mmetsp:Transcript_73085/g.136591  ORF Transcript_73085/g.136591 Transcript_73085/m.136591 type:complete len:92 (-) Transcript_73085:1322-1597(-)